MVASPTLNRAVVMRRGRRLLGPVDVTLSPYGITTILGPNGSGKTTLLRVLHGVEALREGELSWAGATPEQAYVFQSPIMLRRTVRANLAYPLKLLGTPKADVRARVEDWADRIGLTNALDRAAPRLSGGEKQKLALARALIRSPQVLFLDEPCANLDATSTKAIEALLLDAATDGTKVIMATHDLGQARRLASDVVFLLNGRLHETGAAPDIFERPRTAQARAFFAGEIVE